MDIYKCTVVWVFVSSTALLSHVYGKSSQEQRPFTRTLLGFLDTYASETESADQNLAIETATSESSVLLPVQEYIGLIIYTVVSTMVLLAAGILGFYFRQTLRVCFHLMRAYVLALIRHDDGHSAVEVTIELVRGPERLTVYNEVNTITHARDTPAQTVAASFNEENISEEDMISIASEVSLYTLDELGINSRYEDCPVH